MLSRARGTNSGLPVVQRPHHPDPRKHRRAVEVHEQYQGFNDVQPVRLNSFDARKTHQEFGLVPKRPKRLAAGDRNGVVKAGGPGHQPSLSISALASAVAFSMASRGQCDARAVDPDQ
jgi:hypothetical protein